MVNNQQLQTVLLIIQRSSGLDFFGYRMEMIKRRVTFRMKCFGCVSFNEYYAFLIKDAAMQRELINDLLIGVTAMFRDPDVFSALRYDILPSLVSKPRIRIWVAGCSSGEEIYSLAILCQELSILNKTEFFATDLNQASLRQGKRGVFSLDKMADYAKNYYCSGGRESFSSYFQVVLGFAKIKAELKQKITFKYHSFLTPAIIGEVDVLLCRNALIYLQDGLKAGVYQNFHRALNPKGYLVLGKAERVYTPERYSAFSVFDASANIYQSEIKRPHWRRHPLQKLAV